MIEALELTKHYKHHGALNGLSVSVPKGAAYLLVGENGAGKTTLIKILMNLLRPSSGTASVMGVDCQKLTARELAQIGYVSEDQVFAGKLRVGEYLSFLRPFYPTWDRKFERELLARFALPEDRRIAELSHGMRMKFALTAALAFRPRLLILDEPLNGLDPLVRDEFMEGLAAISEGVTMLMSSHELGETETFATHVAFVDEGRLIVEEPMESLQRRFRRVRVALEPAARIPDVFPAEWIEVGHHGNVITFVHTNFTQTKLKRQLSQRLPDARGVDIQAVPLRSIFTSLSRSIHDRRAAGV